MIKTQIIIDGNYLLYKDVFILKKMRTIGQDLLGLLQNDFHKITKGFPFDRVYFVSDKGSSWRKRLYKEYKGTREKDNTINWDEVYTIYDQFKRQVASKPNVKFLQKESLEGDDFIAHAVKHGNQHGYCSVIVASDGDIQQILGMDLNQRWLNMQWNYKFNDERIYLPENYHLFFDHLARTTTEDLFELGNETEFVEYLEKLIARTTVKEIRPEEALFCKIVSGDKGDNVITVAKVKEGRLIEASHPDYDKAKGIGKDGAKAVYALYKETFPAVIDFHSDLYVNQLVDIIYYYKNIKDHALKAGMAASIRFNRLMVMLDAQYMPHDVRTAMEDEFITIQQKVTAVEVGNLEAQLIEQGHFDPTPDLPVQFRQEPTATKFAADDFWEIGEPKSAFNPDDFWSI